VQAVQRVTNEFVAVASPSQVVEPHN
jgi:hypothetical protein